MKLKGVFLFYSILLLFSCTTEKEQGKEVDENKEIHSEELPLINSTEFEFAIVNLPPEFIVDSVYYEDSIRCISSQHYALHSDEESLIDFCEKLKDTVTSFMSKEWLAVDSCDQDYSTTSMKFGLNRFYMNEDMISVQFVYDTYTEGAAHHNHAYYSFSFDRSGLKFVSLDEIIDLSALDEKESLKELLNNNTYSEWREYSNEKLGCFVFGDSILLHRTFVEGGPNQIVINRKELSKK